MHKIQVLQDQKEVLEMADDDPRILKMMENDLERWKKKYPNVTREEIDRKLDEMLASDEKDEAGSTAERE